jgi:hypothetical protein
MSKEHDELSRSRTFGARADIARTGREALVQTFLTAWGDHQDLRQRGAPFGRGETAEPVTRTGTGIGTGRPLYRP